MSKSLTELMGTSVASFFNNPEVRRRVSKIACQCNKQMGGGGGSGTVTSVDIDMPSAFSVSGNPITSSGTLTVTGAGTTSQYVRGDGSLATFPTAAASTLQQVLDAGNTANKGFTLNVGTAPSDGITLMGSASYIFAQTDLNGTAAFLSIGGSAGSRITLGGTASNSITRTAAIPIDIYDNTTNIVNRFFPDGRVSGTTATNSNEFVTLAQLDLKAPINQPVFTGVPQAPTASAASNNTQIATTAFVKTAIAGIAAPSLQDVTATGNTSSNELLVTGNTLADTAKGLHIAFDATANKTSLTNIATGGSTSNTVISMDLHNIEFFTQTGFRLLGLNDQQSGGLALANFNGRVKIEDAFNDNEAMSLGQFKGYMKYGATTFATDGTTDIFVIPHGLGSNPTSFAITFNDTTDTNVSVCKRLKDATNLTLDYTASTPPTTGSMTIYWQVYR